MVSPTALAPVKSRSKDMVSDPIADAHEQRAECVKEDGDPNDEQFGSHGFFDLRAPAVASLMPTGFFRANRPLARSSVQACTIRATRTVRRCIAAIGAGSALGIAPETTNEQNEKGPERIRPRPRSNVQLELSECVRR
jgi:hypothetical protein